MIARGPLWLPLAILLMLAALSFWIERSVQRPAAGGKTGWSDPEGIIENFDALRTDAAGQPHYRLTARRLRHYSDSRLTELESPRFVQLDARTGEVSAAASQATVSADGKQVDLRDNVVVQRAARPGQSALSLRTAHLIVFPERDVLRAPGTVEIRDATMDLRAGAMEFNARQRVIKLSGRVKARYLAHKQ